MTEQSNTQTKLELIQKYIFSVLPKDSYTIVGITDYENKIYWRFEDSNVISIIEINPLSFSQIDINGKSFEVYNDLGYIADKRAELLKQYQTLKELSAPVHDSVEQIKEN